MLVFYINTFIFYTTTQNKQLQHRSGCNLNRLDHLIRVFDDYDRHEFDDQMAMEVNTMKEYVFSILGLLLIVLKFVVYQGFYITCA